MVTYAMPDCLKCKHFNFEDKNDNTCEAFQEGIDWTILTSQLMHTKPIKGDHGIQFEPIEDNDG